MIEYLKPLKRIVLTIDDDINHLMVIAPSWIKENTIVINQREYELSLEQGLGYLKIVN